MHFLETWLKTKSSENYEPVFYKDECAVGSGVVKTLLEEALNLLVFYWFGAGCSNIQSSLSSRLAFHLIQSDLDFPETLFAYASINAPPRSRSAIFFLLAEDASPSAFICFQKGVRKPALCFGRRLSKAQYQEQAGALLLDFRWFRSLFESCRIFGSYVLSKSECLPSGACPESQTFPNGWLESNAFLSEIFSLLRLGQLACKYSIILQVVHLTTNARQ